jgi:hypothetical protein
VEDVRRLQLSESLDVLFGGLHQIAFFKQEIRPAFVYIGVAAFAETLLVADRFRDVEVVSLEESVQFLVNVAFKQTRKLLKRDAFEMH